jgi:hypothetical protein
MMEDADGSPNSAQWKSQDLRGECLAHGVHHAYTTTLEKLGFEEEKGQLREWMTVARDRSAWGQRVESHLDLPPGSFKYLRRH